ncbi:hypothetical protein [Blastococcus sp. CT_GayMR19]|uniref:hypothetical protein n=1 Tax=Blastococcus sp. CT_GayMR19 TaxID=2559608 RepID=UPI001FD84B04|nr:hypothetical protein [Blastococcus sp. CT_GayMR19]
MIDGMEDSLQRIFWGFMLPDPHDCPAGMAEGAIGPSISLDVAPQLRGPVPLISRGLPPMSRADVPEAAVDEHRHLEAGEDHVRAYADVIQVESMVLPEAVSERVERGAKPNFRLRVDPPVRLHVARPARVEGLRLALSCGDRIASRHKGSVRELHSRVPGGQ